jgi:hypothetical protein
VQDDDLHMANVYAQGGRLRLLDWGDASVSHPFASLVVTFRFLEERNQLPPGDPWFGRLRDTYLEPWGRGLAGAFALAVRVGAFARTFAWARQRDYLPGRQLASSTAGSRSCCGTRSPGHTNSAARVGRIHRTALCDQRLSRPGPNGPTGTPSTSTPTTSAAGGSTITSSYLTATGWSWPAEGPAGRWDRSHRPCWSR